MNRTSISDLKAKAKDQLLGNYGIAAGSFVLLFVLIYTIMTVIMSAYTFGFASKGSAVMPAGGIVSQLITQALGMIIGAITVLFTVGYIKILRDIADGIRPTVSSLFYVFKNHPDKVIIISLIMTGAQFILLLPATIVGGNMVFVPDGEFDGKRFLLYVVLYLIGFVISFVIDLMLAMSFMIYVDDPETEVGSLITGSFSMMRGNKFRYFYMILSFLGYWLLILLSVGIAAIWVVPYQTMTQVEFYLDLKNGGDRYCEL